MRNHPAALTIALLGALVLAPSASAKFGPCIAGQSGSPRCTVWDAKVAVVDDGDTVQARVKKGRKLGARQSVRLNGVQAPELHSYSRKKGRRGDCHAVEATERLESLVKKRWVRLTAQRASSSTRGEGGRVRARRSIAVKRGGRWVDVGTIMISEGWGLPFGNAREWASNGLYAKLGQEAAVRRRNIWNPTGCGAGPSQAGGDLLQLKLKWDAEDDDSKNINGEWVRLTNPTAAPVSLRGWWLRDSHLRIRTGKHKGKGYMFPSNAVVPAFGSLRVHVGRGSNTASDLYWGLGESIFENATNDKKKIGDGAYLYDPRGNIRSFAMYPCRMGNCTDRLAGKVELSARYHGVEYEWVYIKNTSSEAINLYQYELESVPWFYEFDLRHSIEPGKSLVLFMDDQPRTVPARNGTPALIPVRPGILPFQDTQSNNGFWAWNNSHAPLLSDKKDVVTLRNAEGAPVACAAWGGERCPKV